MVKWHVPPCIFDPGRNMLVSGQFFSTWIEHKCPHVFLTPKSLQIFVGGMFTSALVSVNGFGQNFRLLALDSARRIHRDRHQDRQDDKKNQRRPKRKKDSEKKTFHSSKMLTLLC